MNIYLPLAILSVILCYIYRDNPRKVTLIFKFTFLVLCMFFALRYNFCGDYESYLSDYNEYKGDAIDRTDTLFFLYLCSFPKYTYFIIFNTIFWFFIHYYFFSKLIPSHYYFILLFYFLFTQECVLNGNSALRTSLCGALFIISFFFLVKKKLGSIIVATAILLLCATIHMSTILILPLIFFIFDWTDSLCSKIGFFCVIGLMCLSLIAGKNTYMNQLSILLIERAEDFSKYQEYINDTSNSNIIRVLISKSLFVFPLYSLCQTFRSETLIQYKFSYKIGFLALSMMIVLGFGMLSRFYMIFSPFLITAIIRSLKYTSRSMKVLVVFCLIASSIIPFYTNVLTVADSPFKEYHTILSINNIP